VHRKYGTCSDSAGLAYSIATAENGAPVVAWEPSPVSTTADEALAPAAGFKEPTATDEATDFLQDLLSDGPVQASEGLKRARQMGFSRKVIDRAREKLGVETKKSGFKGGWDWSLPEDAQDPPFTEGEILGGGGDLRRLQARP
jgi:putative DNA primase/helicase